LGRIVVSFSKLRGQALLAHCSQPKLLQEEFSHDFKKCTSHQISLTNYIMFDKPVILKGYTFGLI